MVLGLTDLPCPANAHGHGGLLATPLNDERNVVRDVTECTEGFEQRSGRHRDRGGSTDYDKSTVARII